MIQYSLRLKFAYGPPARCYILIIRTRCRFCENTQLSFKVFDKFLDSLSANGSFLLAIR
jgi:hypothetical protein